MKRSILMSLAAASLLFALGGCDDDKGPKVKGPAVLGIEGATTEATAITLTDPQTQVIDIRLVAEKISGNFLTATFKADPALVDTYNASHGTSYGLVPASAYEWMNDEVLLPRYNRLSSTLEVKLLSANMPDEATYLLPITVDKIEGDARATLSEESSTYYVLFNKIAKVVTPDPVLLDRSGWSLVYIPVTKKGYSTEKILDGNDKTFAYTNSDEDGAAPPYYLVVDLGREVLVQGLSFTHRSQDRGNGIEPRYALADVAVETAKTITGDGMQDPADWTYKEEWHSDVMVNELVVEPRLAVPQRARYIRLTVNACYTQSANPVFKGFCLAELNVWGNL